MDNDSVNSRIRAAGWFHGTESDWQALDMTARENLAFAGTGCAVAYPTWDGPVDCVHAGCQIRRGEIQPIMQTNRIVRYEMESGWFRFGLNDPATRQRLGRTIRAIRKAAMETGIYDPWKIPGGWGAIVGTAIAS